MNKWYIKGLLEAILILFVVYVLGALPYQYAFGVNNHLEHLPLLYRQMDPNYLVNDWFLNVHDSFNIRSFYNVFLIFCIRLFGSTETAFYWIYQITLVAFVWVLIRLGKFFSGSLWGGYLTAVLLLFSFNASLGTTEWWSAYLNPHMLAYLGVLVCFYLQCKKQFLWSYIALVVASYMHIQIGFLFFGVFIVLEFIDHGWKKTSQHVWPSVLLLLPLVYVGAQAFLFSEDTLTSTQKFDALMRGRDPHHYLPLSFMPQEYMGFLLYTFGGFLFLPYLRYQEDARKNVLRNLLTVSLVVLLLGGFFSQIYPVYFLSQFQPFRLALVIKLILTIFIAFSMIHGYKLHKKQWHRGLWLFVCILFMCAVLREVYFAIALCILAPTLIFIHFDFWKQYSKIQWLGWVIGLCTILFFLIIILPTKTLFPEFAATTPKIEAVQPYLQWLRDETDPNSIVLTNPYETGIKLQAYRATVIEYKLFVTLPEHYAAWYERLHDIQLFYRSFPDVQYQIATKYKANYIVMEKYIFDPRFEKVYEDSRTVIYKVVYE